MLPHSSRVLTGAPWEKIVGYCRAIQVGQQIFTSGTVATGEDGQVFAAGDPYLQAVRCLEIINKALNELDCPISKVIRTRMFVTDISMWPEFARAHQEIFGEHPPVTTMVEVKALIDPGYLIEIEVEATL